MRLPAALLALTVGAYSLAAWSVAPGFYDSFQPLPYNWVNPPPKFASGNRPPSPGHATVKVGPNGQSDPAVVATNDTQPQCILNTPPGGFQPTANRGPVSVDMKPVSSFPAPPPGVKFLTNVYLVTATTPLAQKAIIDLSFSDGQPAPTSIYNIEENGTSWRDLGTTGNAAPFTIAAETVTLGYFAAGYKAGQGTSGPKVGGGQLLPILTAVAIIIVVVAGVPLAMLRRRRAAEYLEDEEPEP